MRLGGGVKGGGGGCRWFAPGDLVGWVRSGGFQSHPLSAVQGHDHRPVRIDGHPEVVRLLGVNPGLGCGDPLGCLRMGGQAERRKNDGGDGRDGR